MEKQKRDRKRDRHRVEGWRDYMTFNINGASLEAQS